MVVVSTAACGPNTPAPSALCRVSSHHFGPTSVPTRGLALQVIQAARSSPVAMDLKRLQSFETQRRSSAFRKCNVLAFNLVRAIDAGTAATPVLPKQTSRADGRDHRKEDSK